MTEAPENQMRERGDGTVQVVLLAVFALSGAAALIYQVSWQRILFSSFGVDIESTTIIVSTFMLGLGCGALVGGLLADHFQQRQIEIFALAECGIGVFGAASPTLLRAVAEQTFAYTVPVIAAVNFCLMLIPTVLMGATLPVLVAALVRRYGNVGVSIGRLYSANTGGACLGALAAGVLLLIYLTVDQCIYLAAGFNLLAASCTYFFLRETPR
ncbi:MAG TPA: fused MFS/spermidine synthase [Steroidobacteraceae bacterium]|jgi:predicted membrane-bound spermidine synthase